MEPSTVHVQPKASKPAKWWVLVTLAAGAIGALTAIAAGGKGTYDVAPFTVELRANPGPLGKTEFAVEANGLTPAHAEAGTHNAPLVLRATIVDVNLDSMVRSDRQVLADPESFANFMAEDGRAAGRAFGIKLAMLSIAGGAAAGAAISFGRWRRIVGAALAGLLAFAAIGVLTGVTYDRTEFAKTRFVLDQPAGGLIPEGG